MLLNLSFFLPSWHIFMTFLLSVRINVRVKRSLGRHWGDWYWFMAACEELRRVWGSLQELGLYWEPRQPRSSNNNDLCWGSRLWLTAANRSGQPHIWWWEETSALARPGQGSLCSAPSCRNVSPTLGCRDKQRDGHYIITQAFIGQIRKSLLRRRKKDLSIWCL